MESRCRPEKNDGGFSTLPSDSLPIEAYSTALRELPNKYSIQLVLHGSSIQWGEGIGEMGANIGLVSYHLDKTQKSLSNGEDTS